MRLLITVVALAVLTGVAGAASPAKQCRQACGGLIAACAARNQDVGGLQSACKAAVLKRCKHEGPATCGVFCGNGVIDPGEQCDGTNLGGATCETAGFAKGTLACGRGCTFNTSGCRASTVPGCGNGVREGAEQCDGSDLGGATCTSLGFTNGGALVCTVGCGFNASGCKSQAFPATGQTTCWDSTGTVVSCAGTGQDGNTHTGAPLAYVDNGDGTITDVNTGLMWEKQSNGDGSVHDIANTYTWDQASSLHVATLNGTSFAGHTDWRVPNVKELVSIMNYEKSNPAVSAAFNTACTSPCTVLTCSCTRADLYLCSSSDASIPAYVWNVIFYDGGTAISSKTTPRYVRAVRTGP